MQFERDVFVTGAAGWLGLNFLDALAHGLKECPALQHTTAPVVRGLVLNGSDQSAIEDIDSRIKGFVGDVRNVSAIRQFLEDATNSVVFHLAGIIHPNRVKEFYAINVEGTRNVLKGAKAAGAKRVVVMSSNSPIGCNPHEDHQFDEESPFHPYMHYGKSKWKMELLVEEFRRDLDVVVIRAPWFYGPRQPERQTLFFSMIKNGKFPMIGNGRNRRSMSYVDNLSQGLILAGLLPQAHNQTYWIADETPYSMSEIITTIGDVLKSDFNMPVRPPKVHLPGLISDVAQMADWSLQSLGVYHQKIHVLSEMSKSIACSVNKAKRELGYRPAVSLREGMRRSVQWCLDHGHSI